MGRDALPAGGVAAIAAGCAFNLYSLFSGLLPALAQEAIATRLGVDEAELAWLFTAFLLGFAAAALLSGPVIDRWGARRSMAVAGAVAAAGAFGFAAATSLGWAAAARFTTGLGLGPAYVMLVWLLARTAPQARCNTWLALCSGGVILLNAGLVLIADDLLKRFSVQDVTSGIGGAGLLLAAAALAIRGFPEPTPLTTGSQPTPLASITALGGRSRRGILLLCLISILIAISTNAFIGHWAIEDLVSTHLATVHMARFDIATFYVCVAFSCPAAGYLSDRFGAKPVMAAAGLLGAFAYGMLLFPEVFFAVDRQAAFFTMARPFALLSMIAIALGVQTVNYSIASQYHPPHLAGTIASIIFCIGIAGAAVVDPLIGQLQGPVGFSLPGVLMAIMPASMIAISLVALALPSPAETASDSRSS